MARMKFLCDTKRCIECNGCVTACKNENDDALEWGIQRRRVVTLNDGEAGENSISVACMHCTDAPCMAVCPADCFEHTEDGIVLHNKDLCIGCGYCLFACPFGAPQFLNKKRLASVAKWTNVPSVLAVLRRNLVLLKSVRNMVRTALQKANCLCVRHYVQRKHCWPVMQRKYLIFSVSVL